MRIKKRMLSVLSLIGLLLLTLAFVSAEGEECESNADCAEGEVCFDSVCDISCGIGEAQCSDGEDGDADGQYDFWGLCVTSDCSAYGSDLVECIGEEDDEEYLDCSSYTTASECEDACDEADGGYLPADELCRSPLDYDEDRDPACADGVDNDGDGDIDYPWDSDCTSSESPLEYRGQAEAAPEVVKGFFMRLWEKIFGSK